MSGAGGRRAGIGSAWLCGVLTSIVAVAAHAAAVEPAPAPLSSETPAPPLASQVALLQDLAMTRAPGEVTDTFAQVFCAGPPMQFSILSQTGCAEARIRIGSDGSIRYQPSTRELPREAGSWCLDNATSAHPDARRQRPPWPAEALVALSGAGETFVDPAAICGFAEPGRTYRGLVGDQVPVVSIRIAVARPIAAFEKELRASLDQYLAAAKQGQNVWPLIQKMMLTPLNNLAGPRLYFSGQLPGQEESSARPLYTLDAAGSGLARSHSLFDSQRPLFFVYNLRKKDRVCLLKGKALDDSTIPLAVIGLAKGAASALNPKGLASTGSGFDLDSLQGLMSATRSSPSAETSTLATSLYEQNDIACTLEDLCSTGADSCRQLNLDRQGHTFSRFCSLVRTLPGTDANKTWKLLGNYPLLIMMLEKEVDALVAQLRRSSSSVGKNNDSLVIRHPVIENLLTFKQATRRSLADSIMASLLNQQGAAHRTSIAFPPSRSLEGGYSYELKVFHDDSGMDICKPISGRTEPADGADSSSQRPTHFAARAFLVRSHRPYISTATEITIDSPVLPQNAPLGGLRFVKVDGQSGPDQLYQLRPQSSPADHLSFAQLVVLYPCARCENRWVEGLGLGIGPTFIRASGSGPFSQLNLRLLWEPPIARGVLISFGPSLRWLDLPINYQEGMQVAVPTSGPEPTFATTSRLMVMFSLGVALDEIVVGKSAAESINTLKQQSRQK